MAKKFDEYVWDGNLDAKGHAPGRETNSFDGNTDAFGNAPRRNDVDIKDNPLFKDLDSFTFQKCKPLNQRNQHQPKMMNYQNNTMN